MKKAQGLSLGYVIVGIIAVVVLVIIILIFTGGMKPIAKNHVIQNCPYTWLSKKICEEAGGTIEPGVFADAVEPENLNKVCCKIGVIDEATKIDESGGAKLTK